MTAYGPSWISWCWEVTPATKLHCRPRVFNAMRENHTEPIAMITAMMGTATESGRGNWESGENKGLRQIHTSAEPAYCNTIPKRDDGSWRWRFVAGPLRPRNIGT